MSVFAPSIDGLGLRQRLGRDEWLPPLPYGPDGWSITHRKQRQMIIVSVARHDDGVEWIHASVSRPNLMPSYADLQQLHQAVFEDRWAYQVFAPPEHHVNIHERCLHLWGRLDGQPVLPNFGAGGSI